MKPFVVLWHIPETIYSIIGDEDGNLMIVTDEFIEGVGDDFRSKLLKVITTPRGTDFLVPIPHSQETERIAIQKLILDGRWGIRCGYGPKTKTWVIRSSQPMDLCASKPPSNSFPGDEREELAGK